MSSHYMICPKKITIEDDNTTEANPHKENQIHVGESRNSTETETWRGSDLTCATI